MNKTKIIATITDKYDEAKLIALFNAGVNIVRINFSHAQQEDTAPLIHLIDKLNTEGKINLGILLDTKGPEVRTWEREKPYLYREWETFRIFVDQHKMTEDSDLFCDYENLLLEIIPGNRFVIDWGLMNVYVEEVTPDYLLVRSENDCEIGSRRHINFPGISLNLPGMTEKDELDLLFGLEHGVDFIAASFIRTKENVLEIREFLTKHQGLRDSIPLIISKIENQEGMDNIEEIVQVSDGIMVARWDLGIEIPIQQLPYAQRKILDVCKHYGKTSIMATELLKSMVNSPFPTRAEISDVYNSVVMWGDCLMLSEETAIGKFAIETVKIMQKTIQEAEKHLCCSHSDFTFIGDDALSQEKKLMVKHALLLADELKIKNIIVFSHSGKFPKIISGLHPNQQIFAFTTSQTVIDEMRILYGIHGIKLQEWAEHTTENQELAMKILSESGFVQPGEQIIMIADKDRGEHKDPLIRITRVD